MVSSGAAGEDAMVVALTEAGRYADIRHSTHDVLGVDLRALGEVDITCGLYDTAVAEAPSAITIMLEIKNTRHWHYADSAYNPGGDLRRFLHKAAVVQQERPHALICPAVVVRKAHTTLIQLGDAAGFIVASTDRQVVLPDHDILSNPDHFEEVRTELGYEDLRLLEAGSTTNYHRGIVRKHIPRNARQAAQTWAENFEQFL